MTRLEVERKYAAAHAEVRAALQDAGFAHEGTVEHLDTYYDHPSRPFTATDEALRIRRIADGSASTAELTYKGPRDGGAAKARRETTVAVDDADALDGLLRSLDFTPVDPLRKTRARYHRDAVHVVLDRVDGLGEFAEVEVVTASNDRTGAERAVAAVAAELGLSEADAVARTYLGMWLDDASE